MSSFVRAVGAVALLSTLLSTVCGCAQPVEVVFVRPVDPDRAYVDLGPTSTFELRVYRIDPAAAPTFACATLDLASLAGGEPLDGGTLEQWQSIPLDGGVIAGEPLMPLTPGTFAFVALARDPSCAVTFSGCGVYPSANGRVEIALGAQVPPAGDCGCGRICTAGVCGAERECASP